MALLSNVYCLLSSVYSLLSVNLVVLYFILCLGKSRGKELCSHSNIIHLICICDLAWVQNILTVFLCDIFVFLYKDDIKDRMLSGCVFFACPCGMTMLRRI